MGCFMDRCLSFFGRFVILFTFVLSSQFFCVAQEAVDLADELVEEGKSTVGEIGEAAKGAVETLVAAKERLFGGSSDANESLKKLSTIKTEFVKKFAERGPKMASEEYSMPVEGLSKVKSTIPQYTNIYWDRFIRHVYSRDGWFDDCGVGITMATEEALWITFEALRRAEKVLQSDAGKQLDSIASYNESLAAVKEREQERADALAAYEAERNEEAWDRFKAAKESLVESKRELVVSKRVLFKESLQVPMVFASGQPEETIADFIKDSGARLAKRTFYFNEISLFLGPIASMLDYPASEMIATWRTVAQEETSRLSDVPSTLSHDVQARVDEWKQKYMEKFSGVTTGIAEDLRAALRGVLDKVEGSVAEVKETGEKAVSDLQDATSAAESSGGFKEDVQSYLGQLKQDLEEKLKSADSLSEKLSELAQSALDATSATAKSEAQGAFDAAKAKADEAVVNAKAAAEKLASEAKKALADLKEGASEVGKELLEQVNAAKDSVQNFSGGIDELKSKAEGVIAGVTDKASEEARKRLDGMKTELAVLSSNIAEEARKAADAAQRFESETEATARESLQKIVDDANAAAKSASDRANELMGKINDEVDKIQGGAADSSEESSVE